MKRSIIHEFKISVFGNENQYCTKTRNKYIAESCEFLEASNTEKYGIVYYCKFFGKLKQDKINKSYLRSKKCLEAEI